MLGRAHTAEELKEKLLNKQELTSSEVESLINCYYEGDYSCLNHVDEVEGEDRRWSRLNKVIIQVIPENKFFSLTYDHGLTEYQDHYYGAQVATEVKPVEKQIIIKEWVTVNEK